MTEEGLQHLLRACMEAAPNGKVQEAFSNKCNELRRTGLSCAAVALCLVDSLYDGLSYGNWIGGEIFAPVPQED